MNEREKVKRVIIQSHIRVTPRWRKGKRYIERGVRRQRDERGRSSRVQRLRDRQIERHTHTSKGGGGF